MPPADTIGANKAQLTRQLVSKNQSYTLLWQYTVNMEHIMATLHTIQASQPLYFLSTCHRTIRIPPRDNSTDTRPINCARSIARAQVQFILMVTANQKKRTAKRRYQLAFACALIFHPGGEGNERLRHYHIC